MWRLFGIKITSFFVVILIAANWINCTDSDYKYAIEDFDYEINVPEVMCKKDIFIGVDYIFNNESLNYPSKIKQVPSTGEIIVLDTKNVCIYVFSPEGKFIHSISRIGQGPGDILNPWYFNVDVNGDIYVYERGNRRISIFSKEGKFYDSFRINKTIISGSNIYISPKKEILVNMRGTGYFITVFNREGDIVREIGKIPDNVQKMSLAMSSVSKCYSFTDEKGRYYLFIPILLEIHIYNENGRLIRKKRIDEALYNKELALGFVPVDKQLSTGDFSIKISFQDIAFKNNQFFVLTLPDDMPKNSTRCVSVLDEDLNLIKRFKLPIMGEDESRLPMTPKFIVLNDCESFLMTAPDASKIYVFKPDSVLTNVSKK